MYVQAYQLYANMRSLHIAHFSAKWAYSIFSAQTGLFDGNFNIICVSITYFY